MLALAALSVACSAPADQANEDSAAATAASTPTTFAVQIGEVPALRPDATSIQSWVLSYAWTAATAGVIAYGVDLDGQIQAVLTADFGNQQVIAIENQSRQGCAEQAGCQPVTDQDRLSAYVDEFNHALDAVRSERQSTSGVQTQSLGDDTVAACAVTIGLATIELAGVGLGAAAAPVFAVPAAAAAAVGLAAATATIGAGVGFAAILDATSHSTLRVIASVQGVTSSIVGAVKECVAARK